MTITVGEALPEVQLTEATADGATPVTTTEFFGGRKVVLFGVPGAFTGVCSNNHLPGYLEHLEAIKAKGVDAVAVISVNDVHVMRAWGKQTTGLGRIAFLADGSAFFAKAVGLDLDLTERGMGIRSKRYSMIVDKGVVTSLNVEETPSTAETSGAVRLLELL
ncbi:MAG: peroxiredoxin [Ancalomicrobiaceae bacterium]|nr:peroxiredoxin [Ancalomicrobiaceae bacterium]